MLTQNPNRTLLTKRIKAGKVTEIFQIMAWRDVYPLENQDARLFLTWITAFAIFFIIGFLYQNVLDSFMANIHPGATIVFVVFWLSLFVIMGLILDNINHRPFRNAIENTHSAIQKAQLHPELLDSSKAANREGISAFRSLKSIIQRPYSLSVKEYDEPMEQFAILVDFDGFWYTCNVGLNIVYNCK